LSAKTDKNTTGTIRFDKPFRPINMPANEEVSEGMGSSEEGVMG
jgi:hypothetical protein